MYIVAVGWIYVVLMMSITEQSVVAGIMTFLFYGVVPLTIILYLMGSSRRKQKRAADEKTRTQIEPQSGPGGKPVSEESDRQP